MVKNAKIRKTYRAIKGARFSDAQARIFGRRLDWLIENNGREITPEDIVRDAKNPRSPFHKVMDWNDKSAAHQHRLHQARRILQGITVEIQYDDGKKKYTRAFVHVNTPINERENRSAYVTIECAMSDAELRQQMLEQALEELQTWTRKYKVLKELSIVFKAVETARKKLKHHRHR